MIKFYKIADAHGYMSNFYKSNFFLYDKTWVTVEHAFQAQKTVDPVQYEEIHSAKTARLARDLGQKVTLIPNWEDVKVQVMYECVLQKFSQNQKIKELLLSTGSEELVEDSPVDWCWGCGADGKGKNELGKILVRVREELSKVKNPLM